MKTKLKKYFLFLALAIILLSTITISYAYFSDTESSTANLIQMGTLNLQVGDSDPAVFNFDFQNIAPGESWQDSLVIQNVGSIDGNFWFEINVHDSTEGENPEPETDITGEGELDDCAEIRITALPTTGNEITILDFTPITQAIGSYEQLAETNVDSAINSDSIQYQMEIKTDQCANEAQGDTLLMDLLFHLDQN